MISNQRKENQQLIMWICIQSLQVTDCRDYLSFPTSFWPPRLGLTAFLLNNFEQKSNRLVWFSFNRFECKPILSMHLNAKCIGLIISFIKHIWTWIPWSLPVFLHSGIWMQIPWDWSWTIGSQMRNICKERYHEIWVIRPLTEIAMSRII